MKKTILLTRLGLVILLIAGLFFSRDYFVTNRQLKFNYPFQNALFPRDFTAPTFYWNDGLANVKSWKVTVGLKVSEKTFTAIVTKDFWKPELSAWDSIEVCRKTEILLYRLNDRNHRVPVF